MQSGATQRSYGFLMYTSFSDIKSEWLQVGKFKRKNRLIGLVQNGGLFPWIKSRMGALRVLQNDNKFMITIDLQRLGNYQN